MTENETEELTELVKALEDCKTAFRRLVSADVGDGALLWALADLWRDQGAALTEGASVKERPF